MNRYQFELATVADDADLRRILAETPMPGRISVAFRRDPSFFEALAVDGPWHQVVAARDQDSGRLVGFGVRSIGERYVNGRPTAIGYLSALRLLEAHRNRGLVARGYRQFRELHKDRRALLYLTTIAEDNAAARQLLTSRRAGLPSYHEAGRYHTVVLPPARGQRNGFGPNIRAAGVADLARLLGFWKEHGPRRQFFPCYRAEDFFQAGGIFRNLRAEDILLAEKNGEIIGTLTVWDQRPFRQTVVHGYAPILHWGRWLYNPWAVWRGLPLLPAPGATIPCRVAALAVVAHDDPQVFAELLGAARQHAGRDNLLVGLHEADPLMAVLRHLRTVWYTTLLYHVCWQDGEELRCSLDSRPPYLELGAL
jgi:hypothetical protein